MIEQGKGGVIINTSSLASLKSSDILFAYCASKFAVNGMTRAAAKSLAKNNIRVCAIAPHALDGSKMADDTAEGIAGLSKFIYGYFFLMLYVAILLAKRKANTVCTLCWVKHITFIINCSCTVPYWLSKCCTYVACSMRVAWQSRVLVSLSAPTSVKYYHFTSIIVLSASHTLWY